VVRRKIRLLGEPAILDGAGRTQAVRGYKAWALLARLLLARGPLDRRILAEELFSEADDPLGSLRWCLTSLRKALDSPDGLSGDPVRCQLPADVDVDVWRLDSDDFDIEQAGSFLEGIEPRSSPEFSIWLLIERERMASLIASRLRQETLRALSTEDHERAVRLAELGVRRAPLDEGAHVLLVKSLAQAGQPEAALKHVAATETLFLCELGTKPSLALRSAARQTVSSRRPASRRRRLSTRSSSLASRLCRPAPLMLGSTRFDALLTMPSRAGTLIFSHGLCSSSARRLSTLPGATLTKARSTCDSRRSWRGSAVMPTSQLPPFVSWVSWSARWAADQQRQPTSRRPLS
jgi:DNA-binding SARP family transcriptional activator